jgi:ABC-2 type transport system permease protein
MKRSILVFKAVTKNWMRSRSGLFFSILFPVLLLLVFGAIFSGGGGTATYRLFVQNFDTTTEGKPTGLSKAFVEALNSTKTFVVTEVPLEIDAKDYARKSLGPFGGYVRILMISEGFQEDLLNGTWKVRVGISHNTINTTYYIMEPYLNETEKMVFQQGSIYKRFIKHYPRRLRPVFSHSKKHCDERCKRLQLPTYRRRKRYRIC